MNNIIIDAKGQDFHIDLNVYKNSCNIIGSLSNTQISLEISGSSSYTNGQLITLPEKLEFNSEYLDSYQIHYTLLEHELAHIIFQTDSENFELLKKWAKYYWNDKLEDITPPEQLSFLLKKIQEGCQVVYNIVEDHRIEHNWGEIYLGSQYRFKHLAKLCIDRKCTNVFSVLLAVRANRYDLIPDKYRKIAEEFHHLLKEVEGKSAGITLSISQEIIKIMADQFIRDIFIRPPCENNSNNQANKFNKDLEDNRVSDNLKEFQKADKKFEEYLIGHSKSIKTQTINAEERAVFNNGSINQMKKVTETQHNKAIIEIKETINPKIFTHKKSQMKKYDGIIFFKDTFDTEKANRPIDQEAVKQLRRFFYQIKEKAKIHLDEEGEEIDPEEYIQFKVNPNHTDIFNNLKNTMGLDVGIMIDLSGSMYGNPLNNACSYARTLIKAFENLSNVNVTIFGYSGSQYEPYRTHTTNLTDSRLITIKPSAEHYTTHTWNAIRYSANNMNNNGKKLLILITDGYPYHGFDSETSGIDPIMATRQAVEYAYQTGCKVFTIQIGEIEEEQLRLMYGPKSNWTITDAEKFEHELWSEITKTMWRTLKI